MTEFRRGRYGYYDFEKPEYEPIDTCTKCNTKFDPEIKSHIVGSYYHTCPECRAKARAKLEKLIEKNGGYPVRHTSTRCEFTGKCTSCKKDISHSNSLVIGNRYYCSDCSIKIRNRRNLYNAAYISQNYEMIRRNQRRHYHDRVSNCICNSCGDRTSMGHVYCDRCLKIKRDKYRSFYRNNRIDCYSPNYREYTLRRLKIGNLFPLMASYTAATKDHVFMPKPEPIIAIDKGKETNNTVYNWVITTASGTFRIIRGNKPIKSRNVHGLESSWSFEFHPIVNEEGKVTG